jgi:hypothetical protein
MARSIPSSSAPDDFDSAFRRLFQSRRPQHQVDEEDEEVSPHEHRTGIHIDPFARSVDDRVGDAFIRK